MLVGSTSLDSCSIFWPTLVIFRISPLSPLFERCEVSADMHIVEIRQHTLSVFDPILRNGGHICKAHHTLAERVDTMLYEFCVNPVSLRGSQEWKHLTHMDL